VTVKIVVIKNDKPIAQIMMEQDRLSIGRKSECDIPIKDPAVSGQHAEIEFVGNGYILRDLGSTNGVHVKGRKIKEYVLKDKDIVFIGEHKLTFDIPDNSPPPKKKAASSKFEHVGGDVTEVRSVPVTAQTAGYLKYVKGGELGETLKLEDALTTIGVPGVQAAAVSKRPQGHYIIHVDGGEDRNRTPVVNGEPIGFKSRKLEVGDLIELANIQLEYCYD
jgi:hypothetical protein